MLFKSEIGEILSCSREGGNLELCLKMILVLGEWLDWLQSAF